MRITPLDIRQKTFEKNFRGYEKDEVNAFLLTLSQEWERVLDENKECRIKLEATEREVSKLREVESSLYKTLKTAEDTGANVIDQARRTAELHLRESQLKADGMINEAKMKARDTIEESDTRAKEILEEMEERLKILVESYKKMQTLRDDLLADLKHLASDVIDRVERSKIMGKDFDPDKHLAMAKKEAKRVAFPNIVDYEKVVHAPEVHAETVTEKKEPVQEPVMAEEQPKKVKKSFFDEIG
ncbi:DivIVA domain-containing protein [Chryseolinea sp. H1M3-3]|uniref:DivIVA domain-containing protein n=1 Tax=Chryseolinea sp. H1M3-3 TaxID=3034144 RepID=UPI0023EB451B|nr:DivIVA domain-containing protein [Chryseolinea sp. H1M3-3]